MTSEDTASRGDQDDDEDDPDSCWHGVSFSDECEDCDDDDEDEE